MKLLLNKKLNNKNTYHNTIHNCNDNIIFTCFYLGDIGLINNNIKSGNYCIRNTVDIKISDLISNLNRNLNKKIKVKYGNKSINSNNHTILKILPKWKPIKNLEKRIIDTFKYEAT